jgi:hypothetical protein
LIAHHDEQEDPMEPKGHTSRHLAAARRLLDELEAEPATDQLTNATAASAHAILVLAEQVAVARVLIAADAVAHGSGDAAAPAD